MDHTKTYTMVAALLLGALLATPAIADPPIEYYADCSDVPEGEICDAEDPNQTAAECVLPTFLCRTAITVEIGEVVCRDFWVFGGVPIAANCWADGKDTTASTGYAEEVMITTKMDWIYAFHGIYDSWDDLGEGFDEVEFWSDWGADGSPDRLPIRRTCSACTGVYGSFVAGSGIFTHTTDWLPTGFPAGTYYDTRLDGIFLRWYDLNQNDKYDGRGTDLTYEEILPSDYARITVGDLL